MEKVPDDFDDENGKSNDYLASKRIYFHAWERERKRKGNGFLSFEKHCLYILIEDYRIRGIERINPRGFYMILSEENQIPSSRFPRMSERASHPCCSTTRNAFRFLDSRVERRFYVKIERWNRARKQSHVAWAASFLKPPVWNLTKAAFSAAYSRTRISLEYFVLIFRKKRFASLRRARLGRGNAPIVGRIVIITNVVRDRRYTWRESLTKRWPTSL